HRLAQLLKTSIQNKKLCWSPDAGRLPKSMTIDERVRTIEDDTFAKELSMLVVKPMVYGYRFDHESGRHDDRAVCVGMALCFAFPETPPVGQGPTSIPDSRKTQPIGPELAAQRKTEEASPLSTWNILGMGQQYGSAWERGDIS